MYTLVYPNHQSIYAIIIAFTDHSQTYWWLYYPTRPRPRAASPFAPANCQRNATLWKACRAPWRLGADPLKMQLLRCFQRIHAPRITKVLKPFLCCLGTLHQDLIHQTANEVDLRLGTKEPRFSDCRIWNQNCLAKMHEVRMCCTVSSSWSQSGHWLGWGRPLFPIQDDIESNVPKTTKLSKMYTTPPLWFLPWSWYGCTSKVLARDVRARAKGNLAAIAFSHFFRTDLHRY